MAAMSGGFELGPEIAAFHNQTPCRAVFSLPMHPASRYCQARAGKAGFFVRIIQGLGTAIILSLIIPSLPLIIFMTERNSSRPDQPE
jgi:hypothetical protein